MFDLNLVDVFSCIGVGIATAILIAYFYFLMLKYFFLSKHNKNAFYRWFRVNLQRNYKETGHAFVTLVLVYSLGIIVQEMTDYMTDSDENKNILVRTFQKLEAVDKEGDLRMEVLVRNKETLTLLGREIFNDTTLLRKIHKERANLFFFAGKAEDYWKIHGAQILKNDRRKFVGYVNGIYYTAKNWAYMKMPPVRQELQGVQQRIDFARSILILSYTSLIILMILFIAYLIKELFRKKQNRFTVLEDGVPQKLYFYPRFSIIGLIPLIFIARQCYLASENNYNERTFGYFVSHDKLKTIIPSEGGITSKDANEAE